MTRAGSGFSGSFVSGFPTARLGFTLRRGHEATEHLSTKGTWASPFLGLVCLSIHVDHLEEDRGAGWGPAREGALTLDKVTQPEWTGYVRIPSRGTAPGERAYRIAQRRLILGE